MRFSLRIQRAERGSTHPGVKDLQAFLTRFGYLKARSSGKLDAVTSAAIANYQRHMNLPESGELDGETARSIEAPRCAVADNVDVPPSDFVLIGCSYRKLQITYRFVNGTADIAGDGERAAVRNAFSTWEDALCDVVFVEQESGETDLEVGWFTGAHGDGSPFDGPGNVLAHAFYPPPCGGSHAGEVHFDDAETWSLNGSGGTFDTETVALHEIGHLLGLGHSSVPSAVMFANYGGVRRELAQDDLDGIRRLYPFVCRRGDSGTQGEAVSEIDSVRASSTQLVTAVRTSTGRLRLISWAVGLASIVRNGDSGNQAGGASQITIAKNTIGPNHVTSCRTLSGTLWLISWAVSPTGTILRLGDSSGSPNVSISIAKIVCVTNGLFVTAIRTAAGNLQLISWQLNANGSIARLRDSGSLAGAASEIAIVRLSDSQVLTAVRRGDGRLGVTVWRVSSAGVFTRLGSAVEAGSVTKVALANDALGDDAVSAVRDASGRLKLTSWEVSTEGSVSRGFNAISEATLEHDVAFGLGYVVTASRTNSGELKIVLWSQSNLARIGDSAFLAGEGSRISLSAGFVGPSVLSSVRTGGGELKVISWGLSSS